MINALIVDDELKSHNIIQSTIDLLEEKIVIVGNSFGVDEGYQSIKKLRPDVVFLDVEMDDGTGFDLLELFDEINFKVIFVTAYEKYAINALRASALDFLLKPIKTIDLKNALNRLKITPTDEKKQLDQLLTNIKSTTGLKKIVINSSTKVQFIDVDRIIYCRACGSYTDIHLQNRQIISDSKSLTHYEGILSESSFFRVHRSFLINLRHVRELIKSSDTILMTDGIEIKLAHSAKAGVFGIHESNSISGSLVG